MSSGKSVATSIQRHIVLTASILALSGCAGVTELVRDVITGLADIDVSGVTDFFGGGKVELSPEQTAQLAKIPPARALWRNGTEESQAAVFSLVFEKDAVYAASTEGRLVRFNLVSGKEEGSTDTKRRLSGGIGTGEGLLLVGTFKGEVLAYDRENGKLLWTAQVSSEVLSPPRAAGGMVVVRAGDGRVFGLEAGNGKRKWVYQGATPSLTVRSFAGALISGSTVYAGFAGGKLVTINLANGAAGWEAVVARPRGATELERIADITSLPVIDEQQVCARRLSGTGRLLRNRDGQSDLGEGRIEQRWLGDGQSLCLCQREPRQSLGL